jgi:hypothetical protein
VIYKRRTVGIETDEEMKRERFQGGFHVMIKDFGET